MTVAGQQASCVASVASRSQTAPRTCELSLRQPFEQDKQHNLPRWASEIRHRQLPVPAAELVVRAAFGFGWSLAGDSTLQIS